MRAPRKKPARTFAACALLAVGLSLAWYGWTIVDNVWWGPGDSSDWAYVQYGLPLIIVGICCLAAAVRLILSQLKGSAD